MTILNETEELFETRGNLAVIPNEFFSNVDGLKSMPGLTPNSKVNVNKLTSTEGNLIHNWTHLVDRVLADDNLSFIVVRSNKVALMLISRDPQITRGGHIYVVSWSDAALSVPEIYNMFGYTDNSTKYVSSSSTVKSAISKTVHTYIDTRIAKEQAANPDGPIRTKKNWDIIEVWKDPEHERITNQRKEARKGMEYKPPKSAFGKTKFEIDNSMVRNQYSNYNDYIADLRNKLKERLHKYIISKLENITSGRKLFSFLKKKKEMLPKKIKINDFIYIPGDVNSSTDKTNIKLTINYKLSSDYTVDGISREDIVRIKDNYYDICYFSFIVTSAGTKLDIDKNSFKFCSRQTTSYRYEDVRKISFADGYKMIKNLAAQFKENKK